MTRTWEQRLSILVTSSKGDYFWGGLLRSGFNRKVKKLMLLSGSWYFLGGGGPLLSEFYGTLTTIMLMYNILLFSFRNNQPHTFLPFKTCETLHCLWACIVCLFLSCTVYAMHMNLLQKVSMSLFLSPHPHTKKTHLQPLWKFHFSFRFTFKSVLSTPIKISNYYLLG